MRKFKHEKLWSFADEHVIDGMIYSNDIEKWVTIEEYTDIHYGTLQKVYKQKDYQANSSRNNDDRRRLVQKIQYKYEQSWIIII